MPQDKRITPDLLARFDRVLGQPVTIQDVIRRGRITRETALLLAAEAHEAAKSGALSGRNDLPPFELIADAFRKRVQELGPISPAPIEPGAPLDYVRLVDEEHDHRRSRRRGGH